VPPNRVARAPSAAVSTALAGSALFEQGATPCSQRELVTAISDENATLLVDAFLMFVRGGSSADADKHAGAFSEAVSARR
jgi:hypothetical protein